METQENKKQSSTQTQPLSSNSVNFSSRTSVEKKCVLLDDKRKWCGTTICADTSGGTRLYQLPDDILVSIISYLCIPTISTFTKTCLTLRAILYSNDEQIWSYLISTYFPDFVFPPQTTSATVSKKEMFCMYYTNSFPCPVGCKGTLLLHNSFNQHRRRCPCIVPRSVFNYSNKAQTRLFKCLPLIVACLCQSRSGTSCFATSEGFTQLRKIIRKNFSSPEESEILQVTEINERTLNRSVHVFILCTTEGPPLSDDELKALQRWVQKDGGALIVSAFSNWSQYEHFAEKTVGWLGVQTIRGCGFLPTTNHKISPYCSSDYTINETSSLITHGPYGPIKVFRNIGDSMVRTTPETFTKYGAVQLVTSLGSRNLLAAGKAQLLFYPPSNYQRDNNMIVTSGRGRILLCTNYHWLADSSHWDGGTILATGGSQINLFLNFVAGALASRVTI